MSYSAVAMGSMLMSRQNRLIRCLWTVAYISQGSVLIHRSKCWDQRFAETNPVFTLENNGSLLANSAFTEYIKYNYHQKHLTVLPMS